MILVRALSANDCLQKQDSKTHYNYYYIVYFSGKIAIDKKT